VTYSDGNQVVGRELPSCLTLEVSTYIYIVIYIYIYIERERENERQAKILCAYRDHTCKHVAVGVQIPDLVHSASIVPIAIAPPNILYLFLLSL